MFLEMSHRQLLKTGPTRKTGHMVFGNALPPIDCCWCLRCLNSNNAFRVPLGLQCQKTAIGVLEGGLHLLWGEFLGLNLGKNQVFRHFEGCLGHRTFLNMCNEETIITSCS